MSYESFTKDPMLVAVASAFIGLFLAFLYDKWKSGQTRESALRVLCHQLEDQDRQLGVLNESLSKNRVLRGLDSNFINNFINGPSIDLAKDEKLALQLYKHLDNIELIKNALERINLYSASLSNSSDGLESSLKSVISGCRETISECILAAKNA
ncbi:hypothetical protein HF888_09145 [Bermanella marisrubri]|uniref:Uncharacterized protein n=1 Tax=Bermanella marisrubri TaxID=207949 RepID=Q1N6J5_9GAMM|nr:hypothetical protein [Bermanella marisrubri]EAT13597.1 hypothetical protein RED65_09404 [Oceanobacter sp. RED65] [Bermanella marisrubri]QIZ84385.1 hypothetical protein HF888_09145 [Bermanella marisrubri]